MNEFEVTFNKVDILHHLNISHDFNVIVRFIPLANDLSAYLKHIEIFFDKQHLDVNQLIMMESGGDYTKISFSEKQLNQEIAEDVFK